MRRLGRFIWLIITMLLVAVAITFSVSNKTRIALYFWPFDGMITAPIWLIVVSSFIIGGLISIFLMWTQTLAIRARFWNLQVKFNRLKAETTQQQSAKKKRDQQQANEVFTAYDAPTPTIKGQETKAFISEPLRNDFTPR